MSMKETRRLRRAGRVRRHIREVAIERLTVHRTPRHIYAQVIDASGARVLAAASTLEAEVRTSIKHGGNVEAAKLIGKRIADKAKAAGVTRVAFDRAGYQYHGRIKALADAARENGLQF
jgi:large subunit ribosomal protein L18